MYVLAKEAYFMLARCISTFPSSNFRDVVFFHLLSKCVMNCTEIDTIVFMCFLFSKIFVCNVPVLWKSVFYIFFGFLKFNLNSISVKKWCKKNIKKHFLEIILTSGIYCISGKSERAYWELQIKCCKPRICSLYLKWQCHESCWQFFFINRTNLVPWSTGLNVFFHKNSFLQRYSRKKWLRAG